MTLKDRAAAWWFAWKWVVLVGLLFIGSACLNVWQWKRAITAPLRAEIAGQKEALETSQKLEESAARRADKLQAAADIAAGQLQQADRDYRRAVATRPLDAKCAPGQERIDAVNKMLGSAEPKP